jgi:fatty acid desaturase
MRAAYNEGAIPMTSKPGDNEIHGGIRIDLPFFSFQAGSGGWGWHVSMTPEHDEAYERARKRVRARLGFYRHVATYAAVIAAVVFLDLLTGGGISTPVLWLAGIWGALLVWQAFNVFLFPIVWSRETEERMIEEEMRRHQSS